jgi:hypothetical protein
VNRSIALLASAASALLLLAGCVAAPTLVPGTASTWAADVNYADLTAGSCLASSYADDGTASTTFEPNGTDFHAVDCAQTHVGEVVGVVQIPASTEWDGFGTTSGPSIDEADEWLRGVCDAYEVLIAAYYDSSGSDPKLEVSPNYGLVSQSRLGSCIAHSKDFSELAQGGLPLDAMQTFAGGVTEFAAALPSSVDDWADGTRQTITTWNQLHEGACVSRFVSADEDEYPEISCRQRHVAQFLSWVPMPAEWNGVYASDEAAAAVSDAWCGDLQAQLPADADGPLVVERSSVGEDYIVAGRYLAQCWAHHVDGTDLFADLRDLL